MGRVPKNKHWVLGMQSKHSIYTGLPQTGKPVFFYALWEARGKEGPRKDLIFTLLPLGLFVVIVLVFYIFAVLLLKNHFVIIEIFSKVKKVVQWVECLPCIWPS